MARHGLRVRLLTVLTGTVVVAVAAGGIALATADHGHDHGDHAHLDTTSGLLVTTRSALRLCVEAGPGAAGPEPARTQLLSGLELTRQDPHWASAYGRSRYSQATALDFGCPAPHLPQQPVARTTVAGPGVTDEPSAYRVWIYLLDEATADRLLGVGRPTAITAAELMRDSTTLFPVSTALLIRRSRLGDAAAVAGDLRSALGLDSPGRTEG